MLDEIAKLEAFVATVKAGVGDTISHETYMAAARMSVLAGEIFIKLADKHSNDLIKKDQ